MCTGIASFSKHYLMPSILTLWEFRRVEEQLSVCLSYGEPGFVICLQLMTAVRNSTLTQYHRLSLPHLSSELSSRTDSLHCSEGSGSKQMSPNPWPPDPTPSTQKMGWYLYAYLYTYENIEDPFWLFHKSQSFVMEENGGLSMSFWNTSWIMMMLCGSMPNHLKEPSNYSTIYGKCEKTSRYIFLPLS